MSYREVWDTLPCGCEYDNGTWFPCVRHQVREPEPDLGALSEYTIRERGEV